jgi:hypothetical protein
MSKASDVLDFNLYLRPDETWESVLVTGTEVDQLRAENAALLRVSEAASELSEALADFRPNDRVWPTKAAMERVWAARSKVEELIGLYTLLRYHYRNATKKIGALSSQRK